MTRQSKIIIPIATLCSLVILIGSAYWHYHSTADSATTQSAGDDDQAIASVTTALLAQGEISQTITAYGNVTAEPGSVTVFSVPFECRVKNLKVTGGEMVTNAAPLIEIQPSPDAQLEFLDARHAVDSAKNDLTGAQQRFDLKLATRAELQQSQQTLESTRMKLDALQKRGAGQSIQTICTTAPGAVSKVDVQQGQIVPAGGPLLELIPSGQIEVRLGIEPTDVAFLKINQPVKIVPVAGSTDALPGNLRLITQRINPDTRLVDVFVTPSNQTPLLLDSFVRAEIVTKTETGLVVPRQAVLPDDSGFTLFTVKDGKAVKHTVTLGLQNDNQVAVTADGLAAGDSIVTAGNLELDDGTTVNTDQPTQAGDSK